jgi:hypothetical protein
MSRNANGSPAEQATRLSSSAAVERITVALIPSVGGHLQNLQERTHLSKTDIVNRAITLYEFLNAQMEDGHDLIIRDPKTGETQVVRFL